MQTEFTVVQVTIRFGPELVTISFKEKMAMIFSTQGQTMTFSQEVLVGIPSSVAQGRTPLMLALAMMSSLCSETTYFMQAMGTMLLTFQVIATIDRIQRNLLRTWELATITFGLMRIDKHW
jgi:hypothetical protein